MQVVGPIDVVAARIPRVQIDAAEVDDPQQRGEAVNDGEVDDVARSCSIEQVRIQSGRGLGARFMKKNSPAAPFGYRFITIARSLRCGRSSAEMSA